MDLAILAQQATDILVPTLSSLCLAGKPVVEKGKEVLGDMLYEKTLEKVGSKSGKRAKSLLEKISPKMTASLEKALTKVSKNSEDPKAKEELQQEILKLLMENPDLAREIEFTINLNIENLENYGQLAVGNYNNFFNFESPSGDEFIKIIEYLNQQRKEASSQEILSRYNPSTLLYYPDKLKQFVTQNRADELKKSLIYLENHRILLLSGVGGVGKSTLSRALVDLRPVNVPEPFWFNFNQNQDAKLGDILEKLAAYMNAPEIAAFKAERREPGKPDVDRLTDELQRRRSQVWLIFDDLSTMLEDRQFRDKGIELLFSSLRYNTHNAKVIVTSRILPILENGESLIDVVEDEEKQHLTGLEMDFAVDYLVRNGLEEVEPEKLEELATGVDGHPLALKLLVELVKEFGVVDTLEDLSMYQESKEETIKKTKRLFDKLAGEEKKLIERISVYRESVELKALRVMFTENTPTNAVRKLIDKSLLETNHNSSYWLHPLVREFAYDDLKNKNEAHDIACKYYLSIPLPENPRTKEELQSAIEAHHHACEAGIYDLAAQIILRSKLHVYLDIWGDYTSLIILYRRLLPADPLKEKVLLSNEMKSFVFGDLGLTYQQLGYVRKAIEYYEQALKIAKEIGDRRGEGADLGNLGNAYRNLGEPRKAIEYYEQALKISKEIGDRRGEGNHLGNLGNAYSDLGEPRKAIEYYEQALKIAKEIGDRRGEGNHLGNLGLAYRNLGEPRKAIEYYEQALKIAKEIGDRRGEGNHLGNLGNAYSHLGKPRKAIEFLKQSLAIGKMIEDPRIIGFCEQKLKELEGSDD
ncbi:tetratricopeptide repeat protein [Methanosarcina sp. Mfa9]|uniref:tetratricopeptide repeat protein n=1 Tax=Methanosarcina sp. Mfa9 TaxID=3439063 RepID=UPI003F841727